LLLFFPFWAAAVVVGVEAVAAVVFPAPFAALLALDVADEVATEAPAALTPTFSTARVWTAAALDVTVTPRSAGGVSMWRCKERENGNTFHYLVSLNLCGCSLLLVRGDGYREVDVVFSDLLSNIREGLCGCDLKVVRVVPQGEVSNATGKWKSEHLG
jgi:hypothetical protein